MYFHSLYLSHIPPPFPTYRVVFLLISSSLDFKKPSYTPSFYLAPVGNVLITSWGVYIFFFKDRRRVTNARDRERI